MNTRLMKAIALGVSLSLVLTSCSTNTQKENTVVGAGTGAVAGGLLGTLASGAGAGWVIAGGAVVGALIGGLIGHSMDSTDTTKTYSTMDANSADQPTQWTNTKTGTVYTIVPTSPVMTVNGNTNCRKYNATAINKSGKKHYYTGVACRRSDGSWMDVTHKKS